MLCKGSSIITVMFVLVIVSILSSVIYYTAKNRQRMAYVLAHELKAQALAEAGINESFVVIKSNKNAAEDPNNFPRRSFDPNDDKYYYDVAVTKVKENMWIIKSTGRSDIATVEVTVNVIEKPNPILSNLLDTAAIAGGVMGFGGSGIVVATNQSGGYSTIHANNGIELNGGIDLYASNVESCVAISANNNNCEIFGNVISPFVSVNTYGVIASNNVHSVVGISDLLDADDYYSIALQNGQVYNNMPNLPNNSVYCPSGGVIWVNGNVKISSQTKINGCIIATGNITVTGGGNINCTNGLPAIVSLNGDISLGGGVNVNGLIYSARGNCNISGGGSCVGAIVSSGDMNVNGSWTLIFTTNSIPNVGINQGEFSVSAWQK